MVSKYLQISFGTNNL